MSPIEEWALKTVKNLMRDMREKHASDYYGLPPHLVQQMKAQFNTDWDGLEQRLSIGLIQARALALRDFRVEMTFNRHMFKTAGDLVAYLVEKSHELEMIGMDMAKQWPPIDLCSWICQNPECGSGFTVSLPKCPKCAEKGLTFTVRMKPEPEPIVEPGKGLRLVQ